MTYLGRLAIIFLFAIFIVMVSGRSDVAQASTGAYPNPPIQTAPLNYAEGASTVTFSFASYNYFDGWYNRIRETERNTDCPHARLDGTC